MDKLAQKRSLIDKLMEKTNLGGIAAEKFFAPGLQDIMDNLREVDDAIRTIASGEKVGEPGDLVGSGVAQSPLKDILQSAKSNINKREYMKAVSDLSIFHYNMREIARILSGFDANVDKIHERFLFEGVDQDDKTKEQLRSLKNRWNKKSTVNYDLIAEANILDFLTNIVSERGRALAAWEKRYPNKVKKIKEDTTALYVASDKMLKTLLSSLKELASARGKRNPDVYVNVAKKIIGAFNAYDSGSKGFKKFYEQNIKQYENLFEEIAPAVVNPAAEVRKEQAGEPVAPAASLSPPTKQEIMQPVVPKATTEQPKPVITQEPSSKSEPAATAVQVPATPIKEPAPAPGKQEDEDIFALFDAEMMKQPPKVQPKIQPKPQQPVAAPAQPPKPSAEKSVAAPLQEMTVKEFKEKYPEYNIKSHEGKFIIIDKGGKPVPLPVKIVPKKEPLGASGPVRLSHEQFYNTLEAMSNESADILSGFIKKYAKSIEEADPETALKLFAICKNIQG